MKLIKFPFENKFIKTNDVVVYQLGFTLEKEIDFDVNIKITADSSFILYVNDTRLCWGTHRNFPTTLMAEKCNISKFLKKGKNIITVWVRHIYIDTFAYLCGEAAFGVEGKIGEIDLSTKNNQWKAAIFKGNNAYSPRINMHLPPYEDYNYNTNFQWRKPVNCKEKRIIENHKMLPLVYEEVEIKPEIIGNITALKQYYGKLYAFKNDNDIKNKCVKLFIKAKSVCEKQIFVGVNGDGGYLKSENVKKVFQNQQEHCGQSGILIDKSEIESGFYLYLVNSSVIISGCEPKIDIQGYYELDTLQYKEIDQLIEAGNLINFEAKQHIVEIKKDVFCDWRNISVSKAGSNHPVIDLGAFYYGHIEIEFENLNKNDEVFVGYGFDEKLTVWTWDKFVLNDRKKIENLFTPRGMRYIFLWSEGEIAVKNIKILLPLSETPKKIGKFESDCEKWNKIHATAVNTLKYSRTDAICSDNFRELAVWLGDTAYIAQNYYYSFYDKELIKYTLSLYCENITDDSVMHTVVPSYMPFHIPAWTFCFWLAAQKYCLYTGDVEFIKTIWHKCLKTFEHYEQYKNENGLLENMNLWLFLDWAKIDFSGISFVQNSFYIFAVTSLKQLAKLLDDSENYARFDNVIKKMTKGLSNEIFYDKEKKLFCDNNLHTTISQHSQIFAYFLGLWDDSKNGNVIDRILDKSAQMCTLGEVSYHWAADILKNARGFNRYINFIRKVYEYKIESGVSCFGHCHPHNLPNTYEHNHASPCHAWASAPVYISGRFLLGVTPILNGYKKVLIEPNLLFDDMQYVTGEIPTPYGNIKVEWNREQNYIKGQIPKAITGYFKMPKEFKVSNYSGLHKISDFTYEITQSRFSVNCEKRTNMPKVE